MTRHPSEKRVEEAPAEGPGGATAPRVASPDPLDEVQLHEDSGAEPSLRGEAAGQPAQPDEAEAEGPSEQDEAGAEPDPVAVRAQLADDYLLLAQRTQANFDNYRKRAAREAALAQERGVIRLAKELLPAIDNLERAVQAAEAYASAPAGADASLTETQAAAEGQMLDGLRLVHAEVLAALARTGIEQYAPAGEPFDPTRHEAVAQLPLEDAEPGTVAEVYQPGYRFGEVVLRPARVLVAA